MSATGIEVGGEIRVTRVKVCNCPGELHTFMDEVRMGTFVLVGIWQYHGQAVTRVQKKG